MQHDWFMRLKFDQQICDMIIMIDIKNRNLKMLKISQGVPVDIIVIELITGHIFPP